MRALIVDDSRASRFVVRKMLRTLGFNDIVMAEDTVSAQAVLDAEVPFDLVLCDQYMPGPNGVEWLGAVKAQDRYAELPVLLMSSGYSSAVIDDALGRGVDEYLIKPFSIDDLRSKLELIDSGTLNALL